MMKETEKILWLYQMGFHNTLKIMGCTDKDLIHIYNALHPLDLAFYYCPYIPK